MEFTRTNKLSLKSQNQTQKNGSYFWIKELKKGFYCYLIKLYFFVRFNVCFSSTLTDRDSPLTFFFSAEDKTFGELWRNNSNFIQCGSSSLNHINEAWDEKTLQGARDDNGEIRRSWGCWWKPLSNAFKHMGGAVCKVPEAQQLDFPNVHN